MTKRIRRGLAKLLELPMDLSVDLPRILVVGDSGVLISNHRGLIYYSEDKVCIGIGSGQVVIEGNGLVIEEVGKEDMAIRGSIRTVHMATSR